MAEQKKRTGKKAKRPVETPAEEAPAVLSAAEEDLAEILDAARPDDAEDVEAVKETPVEDAPAEEPAADEAPAEEAPSADSADETIASFDQEMHAKYEKVKRGDLHIKDLQQMDVSDLHELAKEEGIDDVASLGRQELVFRLIRSRVQRNGLMYGEGVLEILPDGFGFLRSPDYNYLPSPDDIYVSPSQIRRFGLQQGHIVAGQIRPPKESEK